MFDLIIIGGGPGGAAAGVYAARKRLKTLLITAEFGGQSVVSSDIQNWIGTKTISGAELAESFKQHVLAYADDVLEVKEGERVTDIKKTADTFTVTTDSGASYESRTVLVSAGSSRKKIDVKGAKEFENRGITYCATCDGPLFAGKDVAVIGGGNAGFESAAQLMAYCKSVTVIHKNEAFKADPVTIEKVLAHDNVTGILNADLQEVYGDTFVKGLTYTDRQSGEVRDIQVSGVFVEIGQIPNTSFAKDIVDLDAYGRVVIDPWTQKTSLPGIWASGDCTTGLYHQNNIAAGDAVRALEDIYVTLHTK